MVRYVKTGGETFATAVTAGAMPAYGLSVVGTTAETYTLAAPYVGARKVIMTTGGSSAARVIQLGEGVYAGRDGSSFNKVTINSTDVVTIELLGVSTSKWVILQNTTGVPAVVNTTGVVFAVS
jgi:hypothetical protein